MLRHLRALHPGWHGEAGGGRFVTFEGSTDMAGIAVDHFRQLGGDGFSCVVGDFDRHLAPTLAQLPPVDLAFIDGNHELEPTLRYDELIRSHSSAAAAIVHDDIRWSRDMNAAWDTVSDRPGGAYSFDAFRMGVVELGPPGQVPREIPAWLGMRHLR
jgi:predicted O-methyltransferase YrrM